MKVMVKKLEVELPENVAEALGRSDGRIKAKVKESTVIQLWQEGKLSIREAAKALDMTYYDYLELLGKRGIPVVRKGPNLRAIKDYERRVSPRK